MRTQTVPAIRASKVRGGSDPLVMVTAYDQPGARQAHAAGVDLVLVGDMLAMVVLGYDDTLRVRMDAMGHHPGAGGGPWCWLAHSDPLALTTDSLPPATAAGPGGMAGWTPLGPKPLVIGDM